MLIAFNRPELTRKVLDRIREVKPRKLYFAVDGHRLECLDDVAKCNEVKILADQIDWQCEVKTLFSEKNLGCKFGPYKAIDWFFKNIEEGIIFEDDSLPDISFFYFCEELLARFRHEDKIASISGNNFQFGKNNTGNSYYFSNFSHTCGWATWRRSWKYYELGIRNWPKLKNEKWLKTIFKNPLSRFYWKLIFNAVYDNKIDSAWDYQWTFMAWKRKCLSILPNKKSYF